MDRNEVTEKLVALIRPYTAEQAALESLDENAELVNHLHINSMHLIDVVLELEETFDIEISGDEAAGLNRVGAVLDLIQRKVAARLPALAVQQPVHEAEPGL